MRRHGRHLFASIPAPSPGADTDLIRLCIDNELGFTLLLQSSQTGNADIETVMELIDFAAPTAEDFEPTGPVTTAPWPSHPPPVP